MTKTERAGIALANAIEGIRSSPSVHDYVPSFVRDMARDVLALAKDEGLISPAQPPAGPPPVPGHDDKTCNCSVCWLRRNADHAVRSPRA